MMLEFTSQLLQVNPYDPSSFRDGFTSSLAFSRLPHWLTPIWSRCGRYDPEVHDAMNPRQRQMTGCFSMVSLYYVDAMMRQNPGTVADIGCGDNAFKMFYPGIIGYDPCNSRADVRDSFDAEFAADNHRRFDAAMACNSIHFVSPSKFEEQVRSLAGIVKQGGTCHVTANTQRLVDHMDDAELAAVNPSHIPGEVGADDLIGVALLLDGIVRSMDLEWLVVDQCYDPSQDGMHHFDNPIVGNIRLVFRVN